MSIESVTMRVQALLAAQQALDPAARAAATQSTVQLPATAASGGSAGTTFAGSLANAQAASASPSAATTTGGVPPFVPHGGQYGFFPTSTTNYTNGKEPEIAARLDAMGKALHLHLVGLSGYRTPQHSVAVGGFANDPHTRGEAMDTPGVEGAPETTLRRFGLTRPFAGASEADHIQLA
jgi:hypothetical protein